MRALLDFEEEYSEVASEYFDLRFEDYNESWCVDGE